jgi:hypothetical protein
VLIFAGLVALSASYATTRIVRIERNVRAFAYLKRQDPAAYEALTEAHRPMLSRMWNVLIADAVILALLGAVLFLDP